MQEPQYKVWKDKGNNLGIQCLVCNKTFWTGLESSIDVTTGLPCPNCEAIKQQNILKSETDYYLSNPEGTDYPSTQPAQIDSTGQVI